MKGRLDPINFTLEFNPVFTLFACRVRKSGSSHLPIRVMYIGDFQWVSRRTQLGKNRVQNRVEKSFIDDDCRSRLIGILVASLNALYTMRGYFDREQSRCDK